MNEVTIIIQGKLDKECYDFYISKYKNCKVIISTWIDTEIDFKNLPDNFSVILSSYPTKVGIQHLNYQITSTLAGLDCVKTKYTIKVRGDEFWSFPENIYMSVKNEPQKIHVSPVYFRTWDFAEYHMSDHMIAGTTENMLKLFNAAKVNVAENRMHVSKWKENGVFKTYLNTACPEEVLTKSWLEAIAPDRFDITNGIQLMRDYIQIVDINYLKPYKVKANLFQKFWYDNFVPDDNFSISSMEDLDKKD
jgi:hypothetical protein